MSNLVNPILFSQSSKLPTKIFDDADLLDPILNADTKLFIDPLLLKTSANKEIKSRGFLNLKARFGEVISLVAASQSENDKAWRSAQKILNLQERSETGLGFGGASTSGSSRPIGVKNKILRTAKEIVTLGENDPQIISLMGLLEDGVGPDTISDLTTNLILSDLCSITNSFCKTHAIKTFEFNINGKYYLPQNPLFPEKPVILVPRDILRHLPLAADWSDVSRVVMENIQIRDSVNALLGDWAKATVTARKNAVRKTLLSSLKAFRLALQSIIASSSSYDPNEDIFNYYKFRELISSDLRPFKSKNTFSPARSKENLIRIVQSILEHFRQMVETNNLWELLWIDDEPKRERAGQLLFFAVANAFCKANNIDISPETNAGGGPVDFKFSSGYNSRVVVEVKRSVGTVEHGYTKQLEIYKEASDTDAGIFLILDVGGMGMKLRKIQALRNTKIRKGERASEIFVVDARRKISASKRT